jgi:hypothetical protein
MTNALPACLLVLALCFQAQAHGSRIGHAGKVRSSQPAKKQLGAHHQSAQDTTKAIAGRLPLGAPLPIAATRLRTSASQPERAGAEQPINSEAVATKKAADFNPDSASLPAALAITLRRPEAPLGRRTFRTRLVRTSRWSSRSESVEILTCTYAGPLVLAQLPATATTPSQLVVGPGYDRTAPLRPLELTREAVLRLCGDRAPQVRAYAMLYDLHFEQANEVARLLDYYNRIAVTVNE